jgi:putative glutamine amidotransferase
LVPYSEIAGVRPYEDALVAAGIDPAACPVSHPLSLSDFDGLVLTGGVDIDPALYQQTRRRETETPDDERDSMELSLLREALERDLPILAICRGLQLLNVYHGGSLIQHLNSSARHQRIDGDRSLPAHAVIIQPGTLLFSIAGTGIWQVNSRHHQAANTIGKVLRISARDAEDGTVEALERPDKRFMLAVQWHPEDQAPLDAEQAKIFRAFRAALG